MTRAELHNTPGFHPGSLLAAAAFLRLTMPRNRLANDATAIIKNEGHMNGFLDAIEALTAAATPEKPKSEKVAPPMYSQPAMHTENPNKP